MDLCRLKVDGRLVSYGLFIIKIFIEILRYYWELTDIIDCYVRNIERFAYIMY